VEAKKEFIFERIKPLSLSLHAVYYKYYSVLYTDLNAHDLL